MPETLLEVAPVTQETHIAMEEPTLATASKHLRLESWGQAQGLGQYTSASCI